MKYSSVHSEIRCGNDWYIRPARLIKFSSWESHKRINNPHVQVYINTGIFYSSWMCDQLILYVVQSAFSVQRDSEGSVRFLGTTYFFFESNQPINRSTDPSQINQWTSGDPRPETSQKPGTSRVGCSHKPCARMQMQNSKLSPRRDSTQLITARSGRTIGLLGAFHFDTWRHTRF